MAACSTMRSQTSPYKSRGSGGEKTPVSIHANLTAANLSKRESEGEQEDLPTNRPIRAASATVWALCRSRGNRQTLA